MPATDLQPAERSRPHLLGLVAGLFLAVALVLSASLFTRAWLKVADSDSVTVTGSARRNVAADFIVWRAAFTVTAPTLLEAQRLLKVDREKLGAFLLAAGVTDHAFTPIAIAEVSGQEKQRTGDEETTTQRIVGYKLEQKVEVRSADVARVIKIDRDSVDLVEQGVMLTPSAAEFIYTKAGETKVEMLAEATKDARARAEQISSQGGRRIRGLRSARMGVFQITPLYSTDSSWDGHNDITSREKTVTAVVNASFTMR